MVGHNIHTSLDIAHQVAGAAVRGAVYHAEGKLFSHLSIGQSVILVVVIVGAIWLWNRRR